MKTLESTPAPFVLSRHDPSEADATPFVRLDPRIVGQRYAELSRALPGTGIRYAVKANPHPAVLRLLVEGGSGFDVASPAEVVACLAAGANPHQLLYSNPIKRRSDLSSAYRLGVRLYVVDCLSELAKVADVGPGSQVL